MGIRILTGTISSIEFQGDRVCLSISIPHNKDEFYVILDEDVFYKNTLALGEPIYASWNPGDKHALKGVIKQSVSILRTPQCHNFLILPKCQL